MARCMTMVRAFEGGRVEEASTTTEPAPKKCTWGGKREGAGRKEGKRPRVRHHVRPEHDASCPALVTMRMLPWLPSLRSWPIRKLWISTIGPREHFQVLDWSLQTDHLHFVAEAGDGDAFERGMIGIASSFARRLNRLIGRVEGGRVFDHRHHRRAITSIDALARVISYVHSNWKKHGHAAWDARDFDPFSSERTHSRIMARAWTGIGRRYALLPTRDFAVTAMPRNDS